MNVDELERLKADVSAKRISMNARSEHRFGSGYKAARRKFWEAVDAYLPVLREYEKYQAAVKGSRAQRAADDPYANLPKVGGYR